MLDILKIKYGCRRYQSDNYIKKHPNDKLAYKIVICNKDGIIKIRDLYLKSPYRSNKFDKMEQILSSYGRTSKYIYIIEHLSNKLDQTF